jgi:hypothetical protein
MIGSVMVRISQWFSAGGSGLLPEADQQRQDFSACGERNSAEGLTIPAIQPIQSNDILYWFKFYSL